MEKREPVRCDYGSGAKAAVLSSQAEERRTDVFLLELACKVALHKRGLAHATIANEHKLELDFWRCRLRHDGAR